MHMYKIQIARAEQLHSSVSYLTTGSVTWWLSGISQSLLPGDASTFRVVSMSTFRTWLIEYSIMSAGIIGVSPSASSVKTVANNEGEKIETLKTWFLQPRKYYFPGHFKDKIIIFQDKVYKFKGNKSRYIWKRISYLFNVWSIIEIFDDTALPLLAGWYTHFYLNFI